MTDLLTAKDILVITGYDQPGRQCKVLDQYGVFYVKDKNGYPHTTWYNFNHPAHLRFEKLRAHNDEEVELDLSFMD